MQIGVLCSVGGLKEGLVVELSNGSNAMVLAVTGQLCISYRNLLKLLFVSAASGQKHCCAALPWAASSHPLDAMLLCRRVSQCTCMWRVIP